MFRDLGVPVAMHKTEGPATKPHVLGHRYRYGVTSALIAGGEAGACEGTRVFMAAKKVV